MRAFIVIVILSCLFLTDSYGQSWKRDRQHFSFGFGGSGFMGDLGGANESATEGPQHLDFEAAQLAMYMGYRYFLREELALRGNVALGRVSGNDEYTQEPFRHNRNIHFRSTIAEFSVQGEYYFYDAEREGARFTEITRARGWTAYNFSAYFFGGIGYFYFNPQGKFEGDKYLELNHATISEGDLPNDGWYDLRSLRTEGQGHYSSREPYDKFRVTIPFGIGLNFRISENLLMGIEYGFRKTWTDYIDDVGRSYPNPEVYSIMWEGDPQRIALSEYFSNPTNYTKGEYPTQPGIQRGGPAAYDSYMFSFITFHYRISTSGPTRPGLPW